jgi:hypothetical protein
MRATLFSVAVALLSLSSGCGKINACKKGTVLLSFTLTGAATAATSYEVDIAVDGGAAKSTTQQLPTGARNGTVEIDFPNGYPMGKRLDVTFVAKANDTRLAANSTGTTLGPSCAALAVNVGNGGDGGGGPDGGGNDGPGGGGNVALSVTGTTSVAELDAVHLDVAASDPTGAPVTVTVANLPTGASSNADGSTASGVVDWTPGYLQRGSYTLTVTANAADPSRTVTQMVTLTVRAGIDPLARIDVGIGGGQPSMHAIGDFDKDGYGDLAACVVDKTKSEYRVHVIFGSANGISATSDVKSYAVPASNLTISSSTSTTCVGGDFNHDGYSDVAFGDPDSSVGGANNGYMLMVFGRDRLSSTAVFDRLVDSSGNTGARFGNPNLGAVAGDFNGDSTMDFACVGGEILTGTTNKKWLDVWTGPAPQPHPTDFVSTSTDYTSTACYVTKLTSVGYVDSDAKADLLIYDSAIGSGAGSCTNNISGVRIQLGNGTANNYVGYDGGFGLASTLCDINNDGKDDLVVLHNATGADGNVYFFVNSTDPKGFPAAVGLSAANVTPKLAGPTDGSYTDIGCARSFIGGGSTVLLSRLRTSGIGQVDVIVGGGPMPPVVTRSFTIPSAPSGEKLIAVPEQGPTTDVDGDGKQDLLIFSATDRFANADAYWIVYGR